MISFIKYLFIFIVYVLCVRLVDHNKVVKPC